MAQRRMLLNKNDTFVPHLTISYNALYADYDNISIIDNNNIEYKITGEGNRGVIEIMFKNEFILSDYFIDFSSDAVDEITLQNETDNLITLNRYCITTDSAIYNCEVYGKFKFKEKCINSENTISINIYGPNCIFEDNAFIKDVSNIYYYDKLTPITIINDGYTNVYAYPHILYDLMKYNNIEEGDEKAKNYITVINSKLIISSPTEFTTELPSINLGDNNYINSHNSYKYDGKYITEYGCSKPITHLRNGITLPQNATVYFPDSVIDIDGNTFEDESNLKKVIIFGNCGLTYLYGFGHSGLENIEIYSDKIETIKESCFEHSCLQTINISKSVINILHNAFSHINSNIIVINYNGTINEWSSINFDSHWMEDTQEIKVICTDGTIIETPNTPRANEIYYTSADSNVIDVNVSRIDNELLSNTYENKGKLVFKNAIDNISSLFIDNTQLTAVWLPNYNIISTFNVFNFCTNLIQVNNSKQLKHIERGTFMDCINLRQIEIDSECISDEAFAYCNSLIYIQISKRVKNIASLAFSDCTSLESINYEGTIEEWNNIEIASDWRDGSPITTIHCSNGDIQL